MTGRDAQRGVRTNGPKIRALRKQAGFSQRDFAARFAVTARTLQRAESGERILPEMLNSIAAGLKLASSDLSLEPTSKTDSIPVEPRTEQVHLPRTDTARKIVAALAPVQKLTFEYDIDPDEETAEDVAAATEVIEQLTGESETGSLEPSTYVRQLGRLNSLLGRLDKWGIRFFAGSYWEPTVIIENDPDRVTPLCRVDTVCQGIMMIAETNMRYLTKPIIRKYTDKQIDSSIEELKSSGWEVDDRRGSPGF